jgi:UDP-GlcNAc:undecaprenyl-phosphate GlcNAc-1-phosphate transferase
VLGLIGEGGGNVLQNIYVFVTALLAALAMIPFLRRWALEKGEVDLPDARKVHKKAIPRLGGIAIFWAELFAILVHVNPDPQVRGILAGAMVVFLTGLVDDLNGLSARYKFLGQVGGCLVTIAVGKLYISDLGNLLGFGAIHLSFWLAVPFTVFAVVGVINALNLIDGLDGLAGGVSVVALAAFFVLALGEGNHSVMVLCAAGLGAILGFLKYNFFPARIFMGDTGSLTVGFLLGFLAIELTQHPGAGIQPMIPVLILGLPILDTLWVMLRRIIAKTSPFDPDRTHLHHKFLNLGLQHRFTVTIIYGLSVFWAVFSVVFHRVPEYVLLVIYLGAFLGLYLGLRHVLMHPGRYPVLSYDSAQGFRKSSTYLRLADFAARGVPGLLILTCIYLATAIWSAGKAGTDYSQANGILGMTVAGIFYFTRDARNHFLLAMTYVAGLLITFSIESADFHSQILGLSIDRFSDLLFCLMGVLVVFKVAFRKEGDFFISTADILFFGLSILFTAALSEMDLASGPMTLAKGIVLYLAIKTLVAESRSMAQLAVCSVLTTLLLMTVKGFIF